MYFDAHTHLNSSEFFSSRQQEVQNFQKNGGVGLVNIGVDNTYNERGIKIASEALELFPDMLIKCTIGLHPYEISVGNITSHNLQEKLKELHNLYTPENKKHIVAIGEIGIDTHFPGSESTLSLQKELFGLQCERARSLNLPVVIHTRSNRKTTLEVLQDYKDLSIYFHCRSYTSKEIQEIQELFPSYYIGFDANISYTKAQNIRESLRYLIYGQTDYPQHIQDGVVPSKHDHKKGRTITQGIKSLLLETDAPYLPFRNRRGKIQHSHCIGDIYSYIEGLLGREITTQVLKNTKECYTLS